QSRCGRAQDIGIAAGLAGHRIRLELLADADRLEVRPEDGGYAHPLASIMVVAVDLVQDGLDVYSVITADVRERRGPSVVRRRIRIRHRCAPRIGEGNRDRVDFGTEEIVDA